MNTIMRENYNLGSISIMNMSSNYFNIKVYELDPSSRYKLSLGNYKSIYKNYSTKLVSI